MSGWRSYAMTSWPSSKSVLIVARPATPQPITATFLRAPVRSPPSIKIFWPANIVNVTEFYVCLLVWKANWTWTYTFRDALQSVDRYSLFLRHKSYLYYVNLLTRGMHTQLHTHTPLVIKLWYSSSCHERHLYRLLYGVAEWVWHWEIGQINIWAENNGCRLTGTPHTHAHDSSVLDEIYLTLMLLSLQISFLYQTCDNFVRITPCCVWVSLMYLHYPLLGVIHLVPTHRRG